MLAAGSEIGQGKVLFLEPDLRTAQAAAYAAVECIQFDGAHFRRDIAAKAF
jgi:phosphoribosylamine-glycine ligase